MNVRRFFKSIFTYIWVASISRHSLSQSQAHLFPPSGLSVTVVQSRFWAAANSDGSISISVDSHDVSIDLEVALLENLIPLTNLTVALDGRKISPNTCSSFPCIKRLLSVPFGNHSLQALNESGLPACVRSKIYRQECEHTAKLLVFELKSTQAFRGSSVSIPAIEARGALRPSHTIADSMIILVQDECRSPSPSIANHEEDRPAVNERRDSDAPLEVDGDIFRDWNSDDAASNQPVVDAPTVVPSAEEEAGYAAIIYPPEDLCVTDAAQVRRAKSPLEA